MDDADEGGDACAGLRRETYPQSGDGAYDERHAADARRSDGRDPWMQPRRGPAAIGAAARMLRGTWHETLVEGTRADAA